MIQVTRQGMVKTVTVKEYEDEAKHIRVSIKVPTKLPIAGWQSSSNKQTRHVDEVDIAFPLDVQVRPGDLVAIRVEITDPYTETQRFRPALEVGKDYDVEVLDDDDDDDDDEPVGVADVLEVMVEAGMEDEAKEDE